MSAKVKIVVVGAVLTLAALFLYFTYRVEVFEKEYAGIVLNHHKIINKSLLSLKKKKFDDSAVEDFFALLSNDRVLALCVISDRDFKVKKIWKNDVIIQSKGQFDSLIHDFAEGKLALNDAARYIVRYYPLTEGGESSSVKYYIVPGAVAGLKTLQVYVYDPPQKMIIMFVLELVLVLIAGTIFTSAVYVSLRKQGKIPGKTVYSSIDLEARDRQLEKEGQSVAGESASAASSPLDDYIFQLFKRIRGDHGTDKISLFVASGELMAKSHELKGNSFIKIDSDNFDLIEMDDNTAAELKRNSFMVLEKGSKLVLPVLRDTSLLGTIIAQRGAEFGPEEIQQIRQLLSSVSEYVNDYHVINSIMIDKSTGLYSKTYFNLKYNEYVKFAGETENIFSLMLLSLTHDLVDLQKAKYDKLVKIIAPVLSRHLAGGSFICSIDRLIGILAPGKGSSELESAGNNIIEALSKYKLRVDENTSVVLVPYAGISSTDLAVSPREIYSSALQNLNFAMSKEEGNVQSLRIGVQ